MPSSFVLHLLPFQIFVFRSGQLVSLLTVSLSDLPLRQVKYCQEMRHSKDDNRRTEKPISFSVGTVWFWLSRCNDYSINENGGK